MRESIQRAKRTHCDQGMIAASKRCLTARFDLLSAVMNARNMRNDPMLDSEIPLDLLGMMKDPLKMCITLCFDLCLLNLGLNTHY